MARWLNRHWVRFWRSGPENIYAFIWWAVLTGTVAVLAYAASLVASHALPTGWHVVTLAKRWEEPLAAAAVALAVPVLATLAARAIKRVRLWLGARPLRKRAQPLAIGNASYVLGTPWGAIAASVASIRYSFEHEEFVHPLIVRELLGWLSDPASTVIAVDLTTANRSNRFFGNLSVVVRGGRSWVKWAGASGEYFTYAYVGTSPSGIQMVECYNCGGGSGVFGSVALFSLESDQALEHGIGSELSVRPRLLLKILGQVLLGDRYAGKIAYEGGFLTIGPDRGWFNKGDEASKTLAIQ